MHKEESRQATETARGTETGKSYTLEYLEGYARQKALSTEFAGRDLYGEGESSQFLTLSDDSRNYREEYVWDGHIEASGAVYKRMS
jgi:hypothetical protein